MGLVYVLNSFHEKQGSHTTFFLLYVTSKDLIKYTFEHICMQKKIISVFCPHSLEIARILGRFMISAIVKKGPNVNQGNIQSTLNANAGYISIFYHSLSLLSASLPLTNSINRRIPQSPQISLFSIGDISTRLLCEPVPLELQKDIILDVKLGCISWKED